MIGRIKSAIKASLMQSKIEEYYWNMDEQFVSYHDWITQKELAYRTSIESQKQELQIKSIEIGEKFTMDECDILLFVVDKNCLDENAVCVLADFFMNNPEYQVAYGDEDEWNSNRTIRMNPWFKPDFSPELLGQYFYFGNVVAIRKSYYKKLVQQEAAQKDCILTLEGLYELCLKAAFPVRRDVIGHVPYVLYHLQAVKHLCTEASYDALRKTYIEKSLTDKKENEKVSVIIPSKDHPKILEMCLCSLKKTAGDCAYEVIVVDNGSCESNREKYTDLQVKYGFNYIYKSMDFNFSKMCNMGAEAATGAFLLFLNDDIEAVKEGWLTLLKQYALREHVGAVGTKLYYPDSKRIQHAGITNLRIGPVHKLQFLEDVRPYYDGRNQMSHNVLAVTGACLMVRKDVFDACGGFLQDLAVAFNDVELCFRIYKKGYYNVVCNDTFLYHHESLSRGSDETEQKQIRLWQERNKMYALHMDLYAKDPFYHPYLNTVLLDTNYSFAYQYPAGSDVAVETPTLMKKALQQEWNNECLQVSLEYAGGLSAWMEGTKKAEEYFYFQGYQFVVGSDNPEFSRYLLCENTDNGQVFMIPCIPTFRPDLEKNVTEGYASLCGFSFVIEKNSLPSGRYRIGAMAKSRISRLVLCRFTNKFIEV